MMTIDELKSAIEEFKKKNAFDYERRDDEVTRQLFHPHPDDFEIIKDEKKNRFYVIPASNDFSLLFRGQSREIVPCLPTLYRCKLSPLELFVEKMRLVEFEMLLDSHPSVKLYKERGFTISYEGLAQHYGLKTEVMDFTSDIDIALFFAMCPYDSGIDDYRLPVETENHTGIIYMLNPMIYDTRSISGNHIGIFEDVVEPIGLQPFDRPAVQRGYGIRLKDGKPLDRIRVFDFEYTVDEAKEYHKRFVELAKLWVKDELVKPTKDISVKRQFHPKIFKITWERYPVVGMTKSQCNKQLRLMGVDICQGAEISRFDVDSMDYKILETRWNSYFSRVKSHRILSAIHTDGKPERWEEVSPCRTTDTIAELQMLRLVQSGAIYPQGGRACKRPTAS